MFYVTAASEASNTGDASNTSGGVKRSESESSGENEVQNKKPKLAEGVTAENTNASSTLTTPATTTTTTTDATTTATTTTTTTNTSKPGDKKNDIGKEAAIEAEVRAARERALVPLETRVKQFKDMLKEKDVRVRIVIIMEIDEKV